MQNIFNIEDIEALPASFSPSRWTAIIPAAGRGTRLGGETPKLLYPVLGKPLIDWAVERLRPYCKEFVIILAPGAEPLVKPRLEALIPGRYRIVIQEEALGMGHAVHLTQFAVKSEHVIVMWVDQAALSDRTVSVCVALGERHPEANLVFPTVWRPGPYIQVVRGPEGCIRRIRQAREESISVSEGENDCGLFLFKTKSLFDVLSRVRDRLVGARTGEVNLLPVIPFLDKELGDVLTVRVKEVEESLGLNTPSDAKRLESFLQKRTSSV